MENKPEKKETLAYANYKETLITQSIRLAGMIVLGFVAGYLVYRTSVKNDEPNILFLWVVAGICTIAGIITFIVNVSQARRHYKLAEERRKEENK